MAVGLWLFVSACTIQFEESGQDPTDLVDWDKVVARAQKAGVEEGNRTLAPQQPFVIPPDKSTYRQVADAFAAAARGRHTLMLRANSPFSFQDGRTLSQVRGALRGKLPVLVVVGVDDPVSITFADGRILMSRRLVDGLWNEGDDAASWGLKAVAAHELAHHQDGHAIFHWVATTGQRISDRRSVLSSLSRLTSIIPIASLRFDYAPGGAFGAIKAHPAVFEFLADYWAYYTLKEMGAPVGTLSDTLERIERASPPPRAGARGLNVDKLIGPRWRCMTLLEAGADLTAGLSSFRAGSAGVITRRGAALTGVAQPDAAWERLRSEAAVGETSRDELYWSCALWSFVALEHASDTQLGELFARTARVAFPRAFKAFVIGPHQFQPAGESVYATVLDGIPLTEAGDAFLRPLVDERPLLKIDHAEYRGWRNGRHMIELEAHNAGLTPTSAGLHVEALHDGMRTVVELCGAAQYGDAQDLCRPIDERKALAPHDRERFTAYVEGPRDAEFVKIPITIVASTCPAAAPRGCDDSAGRLSARTEVALDMRPYLSFFAMSSGGLRTVSGRQPPFVTLSLRNRGFSPTTRPVFLHAFNGGEPVKISSCAPGQNGGPCTPYILPGPIAPDQELQLEVWLADPADGRNGNYGFRYVVSDCAVMNRSDINASEGSNCSGELRDGPGNRYGR